MTTPLITTLRESCGYLQDAGFHQTAKVMILAAQELERLNARIRELEDELRPLPDDIDRVRETANQNVIPMAATHARR